MTQGTCDNEAVFYYTCRKCGAIECDETHTFKGEKIISRPISGKVMITDTGMNVRTAKKNWILLYIFRTMKDTLRKIMQLPVRYVDG